MDLELAGRVVVVAGASKGIGLACAVAFAREGAKVVGISRDPANLQAAQQQLESLGLALAVQPADLKDSAAAQQVMERIEHAHGPLDVLVNCAGAARRATPDELDAAAVLAAMQAKYLSYMHAIDPVIRRMGARGRGSIVNVIGQGGRQANPQHIAGGSANAALMLATVGYANAYAGKGVRVNAINPGITRTSRVDEGLDAAVRASGLPREVVLARQLADIPLGRMAEPGEIADVAVFLASARASYVTGAIIPMDGGRTSAI
ncbi:SDR family NAD(P)-dependent oxidoreductase [Rhodanobacter denitrificans]|uniref:SDR family NAD(P)-dependent oxidoreductase n=1 Tax=Rhodanobacter denitrificans TaxID=666685 RepID=A0A368KHF0_9GAMM|nr:SDR family oxidoreductase [Rhodanobacter denitrificans]RCS30113.1 SDR family NAD(P)-dependent oxidoreductase [Rhodanobacter denitrificans]